MEAILVAQQRVFAKRIECDLSWAFRYNMVTVPPIMKENEYVHGEGPDYHGEGNAIQHFIKHILLKIHSIEELYLSGNPGYNQFFTLTHKFFDAFTDNGVDLRNLRSLRVFACVLKLSKEEMLNVVKDCELKEFEYIQRRSPRPSKYFGTPIEFLSDEFLIKVSDSIRIRAECDSFCPDVTDFTIEKWKTQLPAVIVMQRCHTRFTLKAIWELIQVALEEKASLEWDFGFIENNESNQYSLLQMQKGAGLSWRTSNQLNQTEYFALNQVKDVKDRIYIKFKMMFE